MNSKPSQIKGLAAELRASSPATTFYPVPGGGALRLTGPDQKDFLQRQTTNDLAVLSPKMPLVTVLTSATARILDVLTLIETTNFETGEPELVALTLPARAETTASYLRGKIFFMDNVTVADVSADFHQIEIFAANALPLLEALGFEGPPKISGVTTTTFEAEPLTLLRQEGMPDRLVAPAAMGSPLIDRLKDLGAVALSEEEYETRRVEAGRPGHLVELTGNYTPLENSLNWAISSTKGCYTGQEVIARQVTYDKVTRKLVGVRLATGAKVGAKVWAGKQSAGTLTSTAQSPRFGPIALAIIKRPYHETGTEVRVGDPESGIQGTIAALPFAEED